MVGAERSGRAALEAEKRSLLTQNEDLLSKVSTTTSKLEAITKSSASEIAKLKAELESKAEEVERLNESLVKARQTTALLMSSTSWRVTAPLRVAKIGMQRARDTLSTGMGRYLRWLFARLPIADHNKRKLRSLIVRRLGPLVPALPLSDKAVTDSVTYQSWVERYDTLQDADRAAIRRHIGELEHRPLISVVMPVFNTPEPFLRAAIQSVVAQLYPRWELCIADDRSTEPHVAAVIREYQEKDGRIKAVFRQDNGNICACTNSALELASGEFVALMDHDDVLPAYALYMVAVAINQHPGADAIYSDEDKIDEHGRRHLPYFKPDWNPDLFYCQNMFGHLGVYRASVVKQVQGFRQGFEGSQDYDLTMRVIERIPAKNIVHIPHVLYHWRSTSSPQSFSQNQLPRAVLAAQRAMREHFLRIGVDAQVDSAPGVEHYQRVRRPVPDPAPLVSLIIPTRDKVKLLKQSVHGILAKTSYPHLEVVIVDNGSTETETHEYLCEIQNDRRVRVIDYNREFNYSAINNFAISRCNGELVGLINNDIVVINTGWLSEMVSHAVRPEVGAVGAMLYYPDDTVQHAGIIVGRGGVAGHSHKHFNRGDNGYFGRLKLTQDVSGVTGACLLTRREIFEECGGLDEDNLGVAFNDVDLGLRIRERGYLIVWTPYAEMYHLESATRGLDTALDKVDRFNREIEWMQRRWGSSLLRDPYYNPNLTLDKDDFSPAFPPRVSKPWARVARMDNTDNTAMEVVEAAGETR
jgi:glycosyltransferase involved in cell wall biosynthesis